MLISKNQNEFITQMYMCIHTGCTSVAIQDILPVMYADKA